MRGQKPFFLHPQLAFGLTCISEEQFLCLSCFLCLEKMVSISKTMVQRWRWSESSCFRSWFDPALDQRACTEILKVTLPNPSHRVFHCLFLQCIALSLGSRSCTAATCRSLFHWLGAIHCDWECSRRLPSTQPYTMCYLSTVSCLLQARESSTTKNAQLLLSSFHQQTSTTMRLQCVQSNVCPADLSQTWLLWWSQATPSTGKLVK